MSEILVENLKQKSLVSQRIVYSYMTVGQSTNLHLHLFQIPRELLLSFKGAHARYVAALEEEKKVLSENVKATKRKLVPRRNLRNQKKEIEC